MRPLVLRVLCCRAASRGGSRVQFSVLVHVWLFSSSAMQLCPLDRQPFSRPQTSVNYSLMEACVFIRQHGLADRRPPDGVVGPPSLQHLADSLLTSAAQLSCRLAHETREFALTRVVPVVQQQGERLRNHLVSDAS
jgi:hypothetical protein